MVSKKHKEFFTRIVKAHKAAGYYTWWQKVSAIGAVGPGGLWHRPAALWRRPVGCFFNCCGIARRHCGVARWAGFKLFLKFLKNVLHKVNTKDHGVPQNRPRFYLIAIRSDSLARPFSWPPAIDLKYTAKELLKGQPHSSRILPEQLTAKRNVKAAFRKIRATRPDVDLASDAIIVDSGASKRFRHFGTNQLPCLTAARGKAFAYWSVLHNRPLDLVEYYRFQGVISNKVIKKHIKQARAAGVPRGEMVRALQ